MDADVSGPVEGYPSLVVNVMCSEVKSTHQSKISGLRKPLTVETLWQFVED